MKILLLGNYLPDAQKSMQKFASVLSDGLEKHGIEVRLVRPPSVLGRLPVPIRPLRKLFGYIDKFVLFPITLPWKTTWPDIVHLCDHSHGTYVRRLKKKTTLITCHDVIAISSAQGKITEHRVRWTGRMLQRAIFEGLNRSNFVACVSRETQRQLLDVSTLRQDQTTVIHNGLNYPYSPMPREEAWRQLELLDIDWRGGFILHVGSNDWYKNRIGVLEAFLRFRQRSAGSIWKLVMVGKPWTLDMRNFVSQNNIGTDVLERIDVTNLQLMALYSQAGLLLFPSLREGFGWPIVEAQACGCPVVTSNRDPMMEIAGGAAIVVDPQDPIAIADGISGALLRSSELRTLGLANAEKFSAESMVRGYIDLYHKLLPSDAKGQLTPNREVLAQ